MNPLNKKLNVYLLSDSSGETVLHVVNAVLAQFEHVHISKFMWPMIRTNAQVDNLCNVLKILPGVIYYTLINEKLEAYLLEKCNKMNIPALSVISHIVHNTSKILNMPIAKKTPGFQHHILGKEYNEKIMAIDFTVSHDDGQKMHDLTDAQIIILGVSRSSKSPTALYLAQRGFKTANIPFIKNIGISSDLSRFGNSLIVGLTVMPERLKVIRQNRLVTLGNNANPENEYTDIAAIKAEIIEARKFFHAHNIPVIDVTGKAIEETGAEILNLYFSKFGYQTHEIE